MIITNIAFSLFLASVVVSTANADPNDGYPCALPPETSSFAAITKGDATIEANGVNSGLAIGGEFKKVTTSSSYVRGMAYMNTLAAAEVNFQDGVQTGTVLSDVIDFAHFEWLALNAEDSEVDGFKVIVKTSGGVFDTESFRPGGQAYDNGRTLVIFNTDEDVVLTKSNSGRQFGPSVIAPFSIVKLEGQAGFMNGFVVAKEFDSNLGQNPSQLQLHGAGYAGTITCKGAGPIQLNGVRSIDGSQEDVRGQAGALLKRLTAQAYPDNIGDVMVDGPNPRLISNLVADNANDVIAPSTSDMLWAWGQFIDHDVGLTEFGHESADIVSLDCDTDSICVIPFDRSEHATLDGVREQVNRITSFVDASMVYGSDQERADELREFSNGRLKVSDNDLLPFNVNGLGNAALEGNQEEELFLAGDVRANEQIGLTAMHTLFVREHNRLVDRLVEVFPGSTDEQLYQMGRKIVGAEIQQITYNEFLPHVLGPEFTPGLADYAGYDSSVDPALSTEFSTVAFRVGHTMLSSTFLLDQTSSLPLIDAFFNPALLVDTPSNMNRLLGGFTQQNAQVVDTQVIDNVRNFLFGFPEVGVGHDLVSLNIQRGRDHGIGKYNAVRSGLNLQAAVSFADITSDPAVQQALSDAYDGDVEMVDAWIGGLAEDHVAGGIVGELFASIIGDQFSRLMVGDPFFFLRDEDLKGAILKEYVIDVEQVKLSDVLSYNTDLLIDHSANVMEIEA